MDSPTFAAIGEGLIHSMIGIWLAGMGFGWLAPIGSKEGGSEWLNRYGVFLRGGGIAITVYGVFLALRPWIYG